MSIKITKDIALDIITGASIYSTGGGIEYTVQKKNLDKIFTKKSFNLELVSIEELNDNDYVCTAYGVGSAKNTDFDFSNALKKGFEIMKLITRKNFVAIFAGETNIETLNMEACKYAKLPILDADCTGGRAVPEIKFDNLCVSNKNIVPLVAVAGTGEIAILYEAHNPDFIENFVRNITKETKSVVCVIDHPISVKDAKKYLTLGIFERALKTGKIINSSSVNKLSELVKVTNSQVLFQGKISEINLKDKEGFLEGYYEIKNKKSICKIFVKNEAMICWINDKVTLTCPDFIVAIDNTSYRGIHHSKIKLSQELTILGIKASNIWRTEKALNYFSPKSFGFNFKSKILF